MTAWPSIISDLIGSGLTRAELAIEVEAGTATINDLARGETSEPRHALGQRLLALHAKRLTQNARSKRNSTARKKAA